ncbi:DUF6031 family protein [Erythrobacter sp.]|uniref:DUF6031 family protein n=1 Tax=Erythrobacter sp. TaxID=1042 RepID=UPI003C74E3BB
MTDQTRLIDWNPNLGNSLAIPAQDFVKRHVIVRWKIMTELRALIEDLEGAEDHDLVETLSIKLVELLVEMDLDLQGAEGIDKDHLHAFGMQFGLTQLAHIDGQRLAEAFRQDPIEKAILLENCNRLIIALPGDIPDPLQPDGQSDTLRAMRSWSKLAASTDADISALNELIRAL